MLGSTTPALGAMLDGALIGAGADEVAAGAVCIMPLACAAAASVPSIAAVSIWNREVAQLSLSAAC
eukprot:3484399-Prymnesium_polylepis.1